jgi:hypothetical protein
MSLPVPVHKVRFKRGINIFQVWNESKKTWDPLKGCRPACKAFFYPSYDYEDSKTSRVASDVDTKKSSCLPMQMQSKAGGSAHIGSNLGSKVDSDINAIVRSGVHLDKVVKNIENLPDDLFKSISPVTKTVLEYLKKEKWTLVAAQVPCASVDMRIGTAVDFIVKDAKNRIILVELKTGGGLWLLRACGKMLHELKNVSDCMLHQYFVQHTVTSMCFKETYPSVKVHASVVLMAGTLAASTPIPQRIRKHADAMKVRLSEGRVTAATKKKQTKKEAQKRAIQKAIVASGPGDATLALNKATAAIQELQKSLLSLAGKKTLKGAKGKTKQGKFAGKTVRKGTVAL